LSAIDKVRSEEITAVILAGGEGSRMGGIDKGLLELNGQPLIKHVMARIAPQVAQLIISANRNVERYQSYGYPVITDQMTDKGPLAGILSALQHCQSEWLLTIPCDTPRIPTDLVVRLCNAAEQTTQQTLAALYTAHDGEQLQPLFSMIHRDLATSLQHYLAAGNRKVARWLVQQGCVAVDFADQPDAFANINTPEMLAQCSASPEQGH